MYTHPSHHNSMTQLPSTQPNSIPVTRQQSPNTSIEHITNNYNDFVNTYQQQSTVQYNNANSNMTNSQHTSIQQYEPIHNTATSSTQSSLLYNSQVPVTIKSIDRELQHCLLTIKLCYINAAYNTISPQSTTRCLHIEVTSESDPYLLYIVDINEIDYTQLKHEQQLLVEFQYFYQSLANMFTQCQHTHNTANNTSAPQHSAQAEISALLQITQNTVNLRILKNCDFRHVDLINLSLNTGNDTAVKRYLSDKLIEYKQLNTTLKQQLTNLTTDNTSMRHELEVANEKLQQVKQNEYDVNNTYATKLHSIQQSYSDKTNELKQSYELQLKQQATEFNHKLYALEELQTELKSQNSLLVHEKHALNDKLQYNDTQLLNTRSSNESLHTELNSIKIQSRSNEMKLSDSNERIQNLQLTVARLETELNEKIKLIDSIHSTQQNYESKHQSINDTITLDKMQGRELQ